MMPASAYDIVVVGSGPAGQKSAIQGAKAGKKVVLIEQEPGIGGNCVYRGTIPSKTLRETALQYERLKRSNDVFEGRMRLDVPMSVLLHRLDEVVKAHECQNPLSALVVYFGARPGGVWQSLQTATARWLDWVQAAR